MNGFAVTVFIFLMIGESTLSGCQCRKALKWKALNGAVMWHNDTITTDIIFIVRLQIPEGIPMLPKQATAVIPEM